MLNFLFVGIGQCGNKFVDSFAYQKNKAIAINTTQKDMACLSNIEKSSLMNIMAGGTKGGAGKTPAIGEKAMKEHIDEVMQKIIETDDDVDYVFLWAGLGGGTGSGGLPILLRKLIENKKKVVVGMTLPDSSEGVEVQVNAFNSCIKILKTMEASKIPYIIIENNKIKSRMSQVTNFDWRNVNENLARIFSQFNRAANKNSPYQTFDETDFKKTLYVSGMMTIIRVSIDRKDITTEDSIKDAVMNSWEKQNFFVDFDPSTASFLTTVVEAPSDFLEDKPNFKLIESSLLKLRGACGTVSPYTGIYPYNEKKESRGDKITVYCMLTGMKAPMEKLKKLQEKASSEQEAMMRKKNDNKVDFSEFESIGGVFGDEKKDNPLDILSEIEGDEDSKQEFDFL